MISNFERVLPVLLQEEKLNSIPELFLERPELLKEVINLNVSEDHIGTQPNPEMARNHTKCGCTTGIGYWMNTLIGNKGIDLFVCGNCETWSMSVSN